MDGTPEYLNFGAGDPAPGWLNLDLSPLYLLPEPAHHALAALGLCARSSRFLGTAYRHYNYRAGRPLPFPDQVFRAIYCSHVLEHLPAEAVPPLLDEFRRVLKPRGLVRVIVPDLRAAAEQAFAAATPWASLSGALRVFPPELLRSRCRAALEALCGFPSAHKTAVVPQKLDAALGGAWRLRRGLGFLESDIAPARLVDVEREDRCRDAIIFELEAHE